MGGCGSGNWYRYSTKQTVNGYYALDINVLKRQGLLTPGKRAIITWQDKRDTCSVSIRVGRSELTLDYRVGGRYGDWQNVKEAVALAWTSCYFGGRRPWFECPRCGRRAGRLYGGTRFLCRLCYDLAYPSQREDRQFRLLRKVQNIRRRLGGLVAIFYPFPDKPKGMHYSTYFRQMEQAQIAELMMWGAMAKRHGIKV